MSSIRYGENQNPYQLAGIFLETVTVGKPGNTSNNTSVYMVRLVL